jgi:hypothetical protein
MGVAHALKTIAHRVGSYKDKIPAWPTKLQAIQTSSCRIHKTALAAHRK